jgi:uncharacterized membrane protein
MGVEQTKQQDRHFDRWALVLIGTLIVAFGVVVPPFQVADEHAHFIRAYEVSRGQWVGVNAPVLPADVIRYIRRYPEKMEWLKKPNPDDDSVAPFSPVGDHYWLGRGVIAANVYCPIAYLPASLAMLVGRMAGASPAILLYAARFADAVLFLAGCYLAMRAAPAYRLTIAAVALLPTTLHQCAAVSADVVTVSVSFVLVALLLRLRDCSDGARTKIGLAVAFVLLILCKLSPWAFVALFLISPKAFASQKQWLSYIAVVAALMLACAGLWHVASASSLEAFRAVRLADGFDMTARTQEILQHPFRVGLFLTTYFLRHFPRYIVTWLGAFGWTHFYIPLWIQPITLLLLLVVAATEAGGKTFSRIERLLWVAVFAVGIVFIHLALFVSQDLDGVQGRYLTPFCLFGLLALRQTRFVVSRATLARVVVGYGLVHGVVSVIWLVGAYYY